MKRDFFVGARACDFQSVVWENRNSSLAGFQHDRLFDAKTFARLALGLNAGGLQHLHVLPRAAVADRRFVGIEFDDRIIDAASGESGEDVFDRMNFSIAFGKRCRAIGGADIIDLRFDLGFAFKIDAAETDAGVWRRGQKRHIDAITTVQPDAGETRWLTQSLLM